MLKPQLYILQEKLFSPLPVPFNPVVRLLKITFCREKKRQPPLTPTGNDPCLSLFPGDDLYPDLGDILQNAYRVHSAAPQ
jgi:hypothetical protein